MSAIIQFVPPAEVLFQPADKKSLFASPELRPIRLSSICEPEQRFWQPAQAVSAKSAIIDLFVLVLFLLVALVGVASCFAELSHLLDSDAIGHVAMKVASGGA